MNSGALTEYFEKRRGGSLRVGRPLPHVRYTRGLVRYRLEDANISDPQPGGRIAVAARPADPGAARSPRGLEFSTSRATPRTIPSTRTAARRRTWVAEFAGGFLGGDYDFNKQRSESRWYRRR